MVQDQNDTLVLLNQVRGHINGASGSSGFDDHIKIAGSPQYLTGVALEWI
jgi:hypothetical protein